MIGSYVVLNLFMAVLLNAFSTENLSKKSKNDEDDRLRKRFRKIREYLKNSCKRCCSSLGRKVRKIKPVEVEEKQADSTAGDSTSVARGEKSAGHHVKLALPSVDEEENTSKASASSPVKRPGTADSSATSKTRSTSMSSDYNRSSARRGSRTSRSSISGLSAFEDGIDGVVKLRDCCWPFLTRRIKLLTRNQEHSPTLARCSQYLTRARFACLKICEHKAFEYTILVFIFASSLSLALQDATVEETSTMYKVLSILDYVYLGIFTIELLIKVFALGIRTYFTSFWTLLDFFIVLTGFIDVAMSQVSSSTNLGALRALRTLRALRPLRAVSSFGCYYITFLTFSIF